MEQTKKSIMFYEICRLCLDEHGHCAIYDRDGLSVDIYKCTGVKVLPADNLPQKICKNCLEIVTKATELRLEAKRNECHLKALFGEEEKEKNSSKSRVMRPKSERKQARQKRKGNEDSDAEYEICETYYIFSDSVASETSQSDSSQKPVDQKRIIKNKDVNMNEHECDVCSKKFNTSKKLYLHQRQHNKNYCCPIGECEKKFSTKGDMQKHVRTHTGEKPYACDLCDKKFAQRVTLRYHKENIHIDD